MDRIELIAIAGIGVAAVLYLNGGLKIPAGINTALNDLGRVTTGAADVFTTASTWVGRGVDAAGKEISKGVSQLAVEVSKTKDVGAGTPVQLASCPSGWNDSGLTCTEPVSCASGLDFFSKGCSGGRVTGKLDGGGTCPDGKVKIDGLCYNPCPASHPYRVAGAPTFCKQ